MEGNIFKFSQYYKEFGPVLEKKTVRAYSFLILSLLTISLFGFFALRPTFSTITSLLRQIDDARLVDKRLQEKINNLSLAQTQYQKIKNDLEIINLALPSEPQFTNLNFMLEQIATQSGVSLDNLNFQTISLSKLETTKSGELIPIKLDITLSGDYLNIAAFIQKMAQADRFIVIDKLGFVKKEKLIISISGQAFYSQ